MNKKILLTITFTSLFSVAMFMIYFIAEKISTKHDIKIRIQTSPVDAPLVSMDSTSFKLPINKNLVLVFFNSDCEYCQYELSAIRQNINEFKNVNLLLVSSENISSIKSTMQFYDLSGYSNIYFVKIRPDDLFSYFGQISIPHILIYDSDGKLSKEFKGETKITAILKYLP